MRIIRLLAAGWVLLAMGASARAGDTLPSPLPVGVSVSIASVTLSSMRAARAAGISSVQLGTNSWFDKTGHFRLDEKQLRAQVRAVRQVLRKAGITAWAIHMPFGQYIDLSLLDERERQGVVALHREVLSLVAPLKPHIILFHPSWYLTVGHRAAHTAQLVKSIGELDGAVRKMGATLVVENMTGPELYVVSHGTRYERPLCRTVDETMAILGRLPEDVGGAIDMNHMLHPERLIAAEGWRLKFIHVADGDGAHERHYYPCSGKGMNDWTAILGALYQQGYAGPFMYECHYKDFRDLTICYNFMYHQYLLKSDIKKKY